MRKAQPDHQVSRLSTSYFRIGIKEEDEDEEEKKNTEAKTPLMSQELNLNTSCGIPDIKEEFSFEKSTIKNSETSVDKVAREKFYKTRVRESEFRSSGRRLTLPVTSIELEQVSLKKSTENLTSATAPVTSAIFNFNPDKKGSTSSVSKPSISSGRRPSITNIAIGASIAPSLAGIFPDPCNLLSQEDIKNGDLRRSITLSNLSESSARNSADDTISDDQNKTHGGRRWSRIPFLKPQDDCLNRSDHHDHHHHHHGLSLHVPSFTFSGPATDGGIGRKFNFGIRRHSHLVSRESLDGSITRQLFTRVAAG